MPTVLTMSQLNQCQVDDFGADVERSHKGALHFKPSSMMEITEGEFKHLREKHPKIAAQLQVIHHQAAEKKAAPAPEPEKAKAEPVEATEPVAEESATEPEPVEAATEQPRHKKQKQKW
jgi:uncharacterized membrane protein